jgi:hypothetical protein
MHSRTRLLLDELYALDPNLKRDEKKLITLIEDFHSTGKLVEPTMIYKDFLRSELQKRISSQKPNLFAGLKILFAPLLGWVVVCWIFVFFYNDIRLWESDTTSKNYVRPMSEDQATQGESVATQQVQDIQQDTGKKLPLVSSLGNQKNNIDVLDTPKEKKLDVQQKKIPQKVPQKSTISQKKETSSKWISSEEKIPSSFSVLRESTQVSTDKLTSLEGESTVFSDSDFDPNIASILLSDAGKEEFIHETPSSTESVSDMAGSSMMGDMIMKSSSPVSFVETSPPVFSYKISWKFDFWKEFSSWIIDKNISPQNDLLILKKDDITQAQILWDVEVIILTIEIESDLIEKEIVIKWKKQKMKLYKGNIKNPPVSYTWPQKIYFFAD